MFAKKVVLTPESFARKSGEILSVFTSTVSGLEKENEQSLVQTKVNEDTINQKLTENESFKETRDFNINFINKINELFN
jgi:hypothetical protein